MMVPVMSAPMVTAEMAMRDAILLGELVGRRRERRTSEGERANEGNE